MPGIFEIIRTYPSLSVALIAGPLVGGFIGAYMGYDNLSTRLDDARRRERNELRQQHIGEAVKICPFLSTLFVGMSKFLQRRDRDLTFYGVSSPNMTNFKVASRATKCLWERKTVKNVSVRPIT